MLSTFIRPRTESLVDQKTLFEGLMRDSYRQAYTLAYRLTGNASEAEDLVQESYVRAYRFFHRYDRSLPFTSWLYRIMTNVHIDGVRRKNKIRTTSLDHGGQDGDAHWEIADESACPERPLIERSLEEPIQMALRSMTPDFRTAVLLADIEGLAYEEIADTLGISIGTVRSRIHRGRKQLRDYLDRSFPGLYQEVGG